MIWFLIAALTYPNTDLISFKINQNLIFNTKQECVEYLKTYNKYVKAGIKPEDKHIKELQEQINIIQEK